MSFELRRIAWIGLALSGSVAGCNCGQSLDEGDMLRVDLSSAATVDLDRVADLAPQRDAAPADLTVAIDLAAPNDLNLTMTKTYGAGGTPFPHHSDPNPDPGENDQNINKDPNGNLGLKTTDANFDFLWIAGDMDYNIGSVSKIDSKRVVEVARYFSVTCWSTPNGGRQQCDGKNGCCALDDYINFTNRMQNLPPGALQAVQTTQNRPSRTAVDFNGDVWVANRAFGGQSSVSKIANDPSECVEHNGTPGIQTSSDINGDGVIDTDCNRDGVPDDIAGVKAKACVNGKAQEFYGYDDECVLFTTNTNLVNELGRPIALGKGNIDGNPSDAWAGNYNDGRFFRIDGTTGMTKAMAALPNPKMGMPAPVSNPYGAVIDASGILWATNLGGGLRYFDTNNPASSDAVRNPVGYTLGGYGITLDRDQNVWVAGYSGGPGSTPNDAFRYTPDRSKDFATLGQGYWTRVNKPGVGSGAPLSTGRGIAADSRSDNSYFVWMALTAGWVVRVNASDIMLPQGIDTTVDGTNWPAMQVAGSTTIGVGVDSTQNIWGISSVGSVATRIAVDGNGTMTKPDLVGGVDNEGCPSGAGDRCTLGLTGTASSPQPYTYSDFTGFGLRNFTLPKGTYSYIVKGCPMGETTWTQIDFDLNIPPSTTATMRVRSGQTATPDVTWGGWTGNYTTSPALLGALPGPLRPDPAPYIEVEFDLSTLDQSMTPLLKSFTLEYTCK